MDIKTQRSASSGWPLGLGVMALLASILLALFAHSGTIQVNYNQNLFIISAAGILAVSVILVTTSLVLQVRERLIFARLKSELIELNVQSETMREQSARLQGKLEHLEGLSRDAAA